MKKVIYVFLLLSISITPLFADWELFKNNVTYYYIIDNKYGSLDTHTIDIKFLKSIENPNMLYSNVYLGFKQNPCFDSLKDYIDIRNPQYLVDWEGILAPDSIYVNKDTSFIPIFNKNNYFYIITSQNPGDSTIISNIVQKDTINYIIKCDSISFINIFDLKDSARFYSINKIINSTKCYPRSLILSKSYGIIHSMNWEKLLNNECLLHNNDPFQLDLVGIDDGANVKGFSFKPFMDAFTQFQPGDILVWEFSNLYAWQGSWGAIRKEITSTYLSDSVFSYTSDDVKIEYFQNDYLQRKDTLTITKNVMNHIDLRAIRRLFDMSAGTFFEFNFKMGEVPKEDSYYITKNGYKKDISKFTNKLEDVIICTIPNILTRKDSCRVSLFYVDPADTYYYFSSDVGYLESRTGSSAIEEIYDKLVGYVRDGIVYGDTTFDWDVSVNEPKWLSEICISPNPARDYIYINSPFLESIFGIWLYQIYDILGNCVQNGIIETDKINISGLATGFYTVRFFNGQKQKVEKLMKE